MRFYLCIPILEDLETSLLKKKPHKIVGMFIGEEMRKAGFEMLWEKNRQEYAPQCKQICAMVPEGCSLLLQ